MANAPLNFRRFWQPVDRTAIGLMLGLALVIALIVLKGDRTAARVRDFSWQNRQVGADNMAFILSFSRPMDHASVEQNLKLNPALPGKVSWAGRRMAYTLDTPAPYGSSFQVELAGARDRFSDANDARTKMQAFTGQFRTRDRAFVYLGVGGETDGQLVLQNLTTQEQTILTPNTLTVMDFKPYPQGDRILFSATDRQGKGPQSLLEQKLYTVTTGMAINSPPVDPTQPDARTTTASAPKPVAGTIEQVLDNNDFQNLKFDLSPDGQTIVVQRVNRQNPGDFGLWMLQPNAAPKPLKTEPGGDFLIAPDSTTLAMSQGQGMAILPLQDGAKPLDFLPKYGMVLSFAKDGSAATMVKFNNDPQNPTRSLFLVTNQGTDKELLKTDGSIFDAQFDPAKKNIYCLYSRRLPGDVYQEEPYLAAIHLKTGDVIDLLKLPIQRDIQMSLAPDGLGVLFDQATSDAPDAATPSANGAIHSSAGKAIDSSRLWFLPVLQDDQAVPLPADPQELGIAGLRPRWMP